MHTHSKPAPGSQHGGSALVYRASRREQQTHDIPAIRNAHTKNLPRGPAPGPETLQLRSNVQRPEGKQPTGTRNTDKATGRGNLTSKHWSMPRTHGMHHIHAHVHGNPSLLALAAVQQWSGGKGAGQPAPCPCPRGRFDHQGGPHAGARQPHAALLSGTVGFRFRFMLPDCCREGVGCGVSWPHKAKPTAHHAAAAAAADSHMPPCRRLGPARQPSSG
jgi:hypothetical protein